MPSPAEDYARSPGAAVRDHPRFKAMIAAVEAWLAKEGRPA
jgi:hypothetical protein